MNRHQRRTNSTLRRIANSPGAEASTGSVVLGAAELLQVGLQHHRAGRLTEAEGCYRRILAAQPDHADALHLLGLLAQKAGRHDLAVHLIGQAIQQAALCAYYPVRRLDAEVLIDALCWIGGEGESYSSATPEPFTFIPKENRTIALADGSITSSFLEMFGRPARDTGLYSERNNQPTDEQRLYLLNGTEVQREITRSPRLRALLAAARGNRRELVRSIYLMLLSRYPTASESASAEKSMQTGGPNLMQSANDLTWALINTKEFLYRH